MKEAHDLPGFEGVAIGALLTKQRLVLVAEPMAGRAVEHIVLRDRSVLSGASQGA